MGPSTFEYLVPQCSIFSYFVTRLREREKNNFTPTLSCTFCSEKCCNGFLPFCYLPLTLSGANPHSSPMSIKESRPAKENSLVEDTLCRLCKCHECTSECPTAPLLFSTTLFLKWGCCFAPALVAASTSGFCNPSSFPPHLFWVWLHCSRPPHLFSEHPLVVNFAARPGQMSCIQPLAQQKL